MHHENLLERILTQSNPQLEMEGQAFLTKALPLFQLLNTKP